MTKYCVVITILAISFLIGCGPATHIMSTCQQTIDVPSGRLGGSIQITETDCGSRKKQNHHYLIEFVQLRESSLQAFLYGDEQNRFRLNLNLDSTSRFYATLPAGLYFAYVNEGDFLWGYRGIRLPHFRIKENSVTLLGKINVEFPCWIESRSKATFSVSQMDSADVQTLRKLCLDEK